MRHLFSVTGMTTLAALAAALLAAPALAQSSAVDQMIRLYSDPDEYYFFEDDRKQVVDYQEERIVRICTGESRHLVPLKVSYDDSSAMLDPGDCIRVEAKQVSLEPAKMLEPNWSIVAEVDTLN
ncbi:MAG TPA: hypothetical protein VJ883_01600 [Woeseiaceae bacterium]|nr:hypothetical protein [Woeseiaceae bacterium]